MAAHIAEERRGIVPARIEAFAGESSGFAAPGATIGADWPAEGSLNVTLFAVITRKRTIGSTTQTGLSMSARPAR